MGQLSLWYDTSGNPTKLLEILSYAASTMALKQERDREARESYTRYQELGRELKGGGAEG